MLTHFNQTGDAHMVDVGTKTPSTRIATATGQITMLQNTLDLIIAGNHKKGDVLGIARIAGIMAAKQTSSLIPLCHPINLTNVTVDFEILLEQCAVRCIAKAQTIGQTGVEMEALTAVQISLLTIYDMCKAVDRGMVMGDVKLLEKMARKSSYMLFRMLSRSKKHI